jgi:hypothetical protein
MDFFTDTKKYFNLTQKKFYLIQYSLTLLGYISIVTFMVTLILLIVYYMTSEFVQYTNNTPECHKCISNKNSCNTTLRYMFIISIVFLIIYFIFYKAMENNIYSNQLIMYAALFFIINIVMFSVTTDYITCLYNNFKNMNEINCPCMTNYKTKVNILKYVSILLYAFIIIIFTLVLFLLVGIILNYFQ